jgi:hypothetical protein
MEMSAAPTSADIKPSLFVFIVASVAPREMGLRYAQARMLVQGR